MEEMSSIPKRWQIRVEGIVQGVGFRPFVYGLAHQLQLAGFVLNDAQGVIIEIEGHTPQLVAFRQQLESKAPPLARVDRVEIRELAPEGAIGFAIHHSQTGTPAATLIAPDTAPCPDCLRELRDPTDRRFHYPFLNCTNCGPRLTIVADIPYDRANTTMRSFPLCPTCQAEYDDPLNRRFHAQPTACPVCGPRLEYRQRAAEPLLANDALQAAVDALLHGQILAIKGLGGYHLACDAQQDAVVARLRARKQREAKPFALMVADVAQARQLCVVSEDEAALLESWRRPIVLFERRADCHLPEAIAPQHTTLGIMLPYTPLHHLIFDAIAASGRPQPYALVMTSGNLSDEPIAYADDDALTRLSDIADGFLLHNRAILTRCDDSVVRLATAGTQLLRRSRGYAPEPVRLTQAVPQPLLAYGAHLKNTFCLARERQAFLSHHIGDLENLETLEAFQAGIAHYQRLFAITPAIAVHDLHPEYLATKEALASGLPTIGVQHHHAHIASVLAEHGLDEKVIGVALDGTGYGSDGAIWGGEILLAEAARFQRVGQLAYVPLPGGEQAIRQPWRMAAAYLAQIYGADFQQLDLPFTRQLDWASWSVLARMIERGINSPLTSSAGRLFDAVAALIGVRQTVLYEGQAAIELEAIATPTTTGYPFRVQDGEPFQIDVLPMFEAIVSDLQHQISLNIIAGRFHQSMATAIVAACQRVRAASDIQAVALSGGVFQNQLLLRLLHTQLSTQGFRVYTNRLVPPNDGGLSFGQVAVAAAQLRERR